MVVRARIVGVVTGLLSLLGLSGIWGFTEHRLHPVAGAGATAVFLVAAGLGAWCQLFLNRRAIRLTDWGPIPEGEESAPESATTRSQVIGVVSSFGAILGGNLFFVFGGQNFILWATMTVMAATAGFGLGPVPWYRMLSERGRSLR